MKRYSRLFIVILLVGLLATFFQANSSGANAQEDQKVFLPVVTKPKDYYSVLGPDGGSVECLAIDPTDSSTLYAGTWGNGIYKSFDGGDTWLESSSGLAKAFIYGIVIDPSDADHILASVYKKGIFQSFDGGENWSATIGWPYQAVVYSIVFHPDDADILYAGIRTPTIYNPPNNPIYPGYVYKSVDGGKTWFNSSAGLVLDYVYDLAIDPNHPDVIYAAMHTNGVYRSADGGATWEARNGNLQGYDIRAVDVDPDTSYVYIGHWDGDGVSFSQNGGENWWKIQSTEDRQYYVYELQFDPNESDTVYLSTTTGVKRCINPWWGTNCTDLAFNNQFVYDLLLDANGPVDGSGRSARMYVGLQNYGIYKSIDSGANFQPSYAGVQAHIVTSVLTHPTQSSVLYMSIYGHGVWKSFDEGDTWAPINVGLTNLNIDSLYFRPGNPDVIYATGAASGVYRTENGGGSWTSINSFLGRSMIEVDEDQIISRIYQAHLKVYPWLDPIDIEATIYSTSVIDRGTLALPKVCTLSFDPDNPFLMVAGTDGDGVWKSDNGGNSWTDTPLWSDKVYSSMVDPTVQSRYFVGLMTHGVKTSQFRQWWLPVNDGFHYSPDIYSLVMKSAGVYYAGTDGGVYISENSAVNWTRIGLQNERISLINLDPTKPLEIWAVTDNGLFVSPDSGTNWYLQGWLFNDQVLSIANGYGGYPKYIGLSGGNLYRLNP